MNRNNFHEDQLRHFIIKAQNAREDGHPVGCTPKRKASKATMQELLESNSTQQDVRERLLMLVEPAPPKDDTAALLDRLSPEQRKKAEAWLASI